MKQKLITETDKSGNLDKLIPGQDEWLHHVRAQVCHISQITLRNLNHIANLSCQSPVFDIIILGSTNLVATRPPVENFK